MKIQETLKIVHPPNSNSYKLVQVLLMTSHSYANVHTHTHTGIITQIQHRQIKFLKAVFEISSMRLSSHFEKWFLVQTLGHVKISHLKGTGNRRNKFIKKVFHFLNRDARPSSVSLPYSICIADGTISTHELFTQL